MSRATYSKQAVDDIEDISHYSEYTWGVAHAIKYITGLKRACELVGNFPLSGSTLDNGPSGLRKMLYKRHWIIYQPLTTTAKIVRVFHVREFYVRNWQWLDLL